MRSTPLSDNWRRTICRILFLLVCVLPTLITCYWILHPQTAQQWETAIRAELGVSTKIDSVETPGPNVTVLRGLQLIDATGQELLSATQVRVIRGEPNRVVIDYPASLSCQAIGRLIETMGVSLASGNLGRSAWRVEFGSATICRDTAPAELETALAISGLLIELDNYADGPGAKIRFQLKNDRIGNQIHAYIQSGGDSPRQFGLNTGQTFLPCWLFAEVIPHLEGLGSDCQFNGIVNSFPSDSEPRQRVSELSGTFTHVDFSRLAAPYQHQLSGHGTASVTKLELRDGKVLGVGEARIGCRRGTIGIPLLRSASQHLGFVSQDFEPEVTSVEFRQLDLGLRLHQGKFSFWGRTDGIVAADAFGHDLLGHFDQTTRSINDVANFLVGEETSREQQTELMLAVLNHFHRPAGRAEAVQNEGKLRIADRHEAPQF